MHTHAQKPKTKCPAPPSKPSTTSRPCLEQSREVRGILRSEPVSDMETPGHTRQEFGADALKNALAGNPLHASLHYPVAPETHGSGANRSGSATRRAGSESRGETSSPGDQGEVNLGDELEGDASEREPASRLEDSQKFFSAGSPRPPLLITSSRPGWLSRLKHTASRKDTVAMTQNGVTVFRPRRLTVGEVADVLRHERVHRLQQEAFFFGRPQGTFSQLEAEAQSVPASKAFAPHFMPFYSAPPQLALAYTLSEIQERLNAVERVLSRLEARTDNQPNKLRQLRDARRALEQFREQLGGMGPDVVQRLENAEIIVERVERALAALGERRAEIIRTEQDTTRREDYVREVDYVRDAYLAAVLLMFTSTAQRDFELAEAMAQDLPRRLLNVDLGRIERHAQSRQGGTIQGARDELIAWLAWFRGRLDNLPQLAQSYQRARQQGGSALQRAQQQLEQETLLLELSLRGLAQLDRAIAAAEFYGDQRSLDPFIFAALSRLTGRTLRLKQLSMAIDVPGLQQAVQSLETDEHVADFYRALPAMLRASHLVTQVGITLVSAIVSAGVGSAFFQAARGTAATAGMGRMALAVAGTAVVEGLVFTGVHTSLEAALLGRQPTARQFLIDLAWNIGLFGTLRVLSLGVGAGLARLELPMLQGPASLAGSYPVLHGYGLLRFRLEQGRMPTDQEMQTMTAHNLIMMLALSIGTRAASRRFPAGGRQSPMMRYFRDTYGPQFEALEAARQSLLGEIAADLRAGRGADPPRQAALQARAQVVEQSFADLLTRVQGDARIDIQALRTEMAQARGFLLEGSQELLQRTLGVSEEVALQPTGGLRSYTYRSGGTNRLLARFRELGIRAAVDQDPVTGLRTITTRPEPGELPLTFTERVETRSGRQEIAIDISTPEVQRFFTEIGLGPDAALRRTVIYMMETHWARQPEQNLQWAIRQTRRELSARQQQHPGQSMDLIVREIRERGQVHLEPQNAPLVPVAREMAGRGFLRSQEWLDARNAEQRRGAVAEYFARRELSSAQAPGTRLLRNVYFIGSRFRDAQMTQPDRVRTTLAEADVMAVRETSTGFEAVQIVNVKAGRAEAGSATAQNQLAIRAIDAMEAGQPFTVQEGGQTYYWRVLRIEGTEIGTGARVDLTGRLRQTPDGTSSETMGPRGARGYTRHLPYTNQELDRIGTLLQELQRMQTPGY